MPKLVTDQRQSLDVLKDLEDKLEKANKDKLEQESQIKGYQNRIVTMDSDKRNQQFKID